VCGTAAVENICDRDGVFDRDRVVYQPVSSEREFARSLFEPGEFYEIFADTPISIGKQRDAKCSCAKARRGEHKNFMVIDSPYEPPDAPELRLDTVATNPEACVAQILAVLDSSSGINTRLGSSGR
jgi:bifunctional enzyme CysN/CysC